MTESEAGIAIYGNLDIFQQKLADGCNEVQFGEGVAFSESDPLIRIRIVALFAFFRPSRAEVLMQQRVWLKRDQLVLIHGRDWWPVTFENEAALQTHARNVRVRLGPRISLAKVIEALRPVASANK